MQRNWGHYSKLKLVFIDEACDDYVNYEQPYWTTSANGEQVVRMETYPPCEVDPEWSLYDGIPLGSRAVNEYCKYQIIRVKITNGTDNQNSGVGRTEMNNEQDGMELNLRGHCNAFGQKRCVRFVELIALHEFGHALGFKHEHRRSDAPSLCSGRYPESKRDPALSDEYLITKYDSRSLMNYCTEVGKVYSMYIGPATAKNYEWQLLQELDPVTISKTDISGLQEIYGKKVEALDDKYKEARYVGKAETCKERWGADAFKRSESCYSCPRGYIPSTKKISGSKACVDWVSLWEREWDRATYEGKAGCPAAPPGYERAFKHRFTGKCYACPSGYIRSAKLDVDGPEACVRR